jgi:hypothetical protein
MQSRSGNWIMALGGLLAFSGVCFLPAAFGDHADPSMLGAGASIFALGALTISFGIYLKAQALRTQAANSKSDQDAAQSRPPKVACELCRTEAPVIQCKVHRFHMCAKCLANHYDFRSCVYAPITRSSLAAQGSKAMSAKAR